MLLQSLHFRQAIIEIKSHDQLCLTINHKLIFFIDFFVYKAEILVFETSVKSESVKFCNSKAAICHRAKVWLALWSPVPSLVAKGTNGRQSHQ